MTERVAATRTGDELDLLLDAVVTAPTLAATGLLNGEEDDAPTTNDGTA